MGYTGHVQDDESGMIYMQARYYDPIIGRFMAIDPIGVTPSNPYSFNRYGYANGNPMKFIDPNGQEVVSANAKNNTTIANMINSRALGTFGFDKNNKLVMLDAKGNNSERSSHYQTRLLQAIKSQDTIKINISETFTDPQTGNEVSTGYTMGGGVTIGRLKGGEQLVVISGTTHTSVAAEGGGFLAPAPADTLAHELVGHAIPHIAGTDTGDAVKNENKVRAQIPGGGQRAIRQWSPDPE